MFSTGTFLRRLFCLSHDYGITSEPGAIFMRCRKCGHRTHGWHVDAEEQRAHRPGHRPVAAEQDAASPLGLPIRNRAVRDA